MQLTQLIQSTVEYIDKNDIRESDVLMREVSEIFQTLLDTIKCSPITAEHVEPLITILLRIFQFTHWMRKLTAGTVIVYLLQNFPELFKAEIPRIHKVVAEQIKSDKRETRDIAAQVIASFDDENFNSFITNLNLKDDDNYVVREAISMTIGHRLKKQARLDLLPVLKKNLEYKSTQININYVHWYTQKAIVKCQLNKCSDMSMYELIKMSFDIPEMKVRKTAAEAAGILYATSQEGFKLMLEELKKITTFQPDIEYSIHTILMSISVALQILTGTHISFKILAYQVQPAEMMELTETIQNLYNKLPISFSGMKTLDGIYKSALISALIPQSETIKELLDRDEVMCLDGAINASIYMQRFQKQSNKSYMLQLLLLCFYSSKAISVLAMRALYFSKLWAGQEININTFDFTGIEVDELIEFVALKSKSASCDIRMCAMRLMQQYITQQKIDSSKLDKIIAVLLQVLQNQKQSNMSALKAACDLTSLIAPQLSVQQQEKLNPIVEQLFYERQDCAGNLAKYFALIGHSRACQMLLIYAFDAVNLGLSEQCKIAAPVAVKYYNSAEFAEVVETLLDDDSLVLNGVSRLLHALKYQCQITIDAEILTVIKERADFFDEVTTVFDAYAEVLVNEDAKTTDNYEHKLDSKIEFDPTPIETAIFLKNQWKKQQTLSGLEGIIQSQNKKLSEETIRLCQEIMYETTVQAETKQQLCASLLGSNCILPAQKEFDVKKNEVFDFNKING
ncbi:Conserved_hypothetical protein [Hexamita inflata]|uniref:Uncharacterized protein n=2 Tax=Hexamita inflata TaxID=28002 RepID=A0AA86UDD2_9EUKA|nr:Conserved hypothetical protein [Hexamita inflata]